jgi:hypothetical protein
MLHVGAAIGRQAVEGNAWPGRAASFQLILS